MKRKVLLIVSSIELIISLYYTLTEYRDGLTELFLAFYIFLGAVLLAFVIKLILDCFTPKSSWIPYVFLHCLTCPGIFYFVCLAVPDFAKNAYESYDIQIDDDVSIYSILINTYRKEYSISMLTKNPEGVRHRVGAKGEYSNNGQIIYFSLENVRYTYTPINKKEETFLDSIKKGIYMDKDSIYGLNGKNYALQRVKGIE